MPDRTSTAAHLADVAALAVAVERDAQRAAPEQQARDTRLAPLVGQASASDPAAAVAWLRAVAADDPEVAELRARAAHATEALAGMAVLLGGLAGALAAWGTFTFSGTGRINVVTLLAVFVVVPTVLLLAFGLATLPRRALAWLPGATAVIAFLRAASPGQFALALLRRLPGRWREASQRLLPLWQAHQTLYGPLEKWWVLQASQRFALAFQSAALLVAALLVVFTDLAFGWSTTLTTGDASQDAARLHTLTQAAAAPWQWVWPAAAPALELIETSRYFRVAGETVSPAAAARLGGWWPFVLMAMATYGLLPRVATLAWASRRLRIRAAQTLVQTPGWTAIVRRLHRAHIQTSAVDPEVARAGATDAPAPEPAPPAASSPGPGHWQAIINWSAVPLPDEAIQQEYGPLPILRAGGASELSADEHVVRQVAGQAPTGDVLILVKAWEPPLLEFLDFAQALRRALGRGRAIVVRPVGLGADGDGHRPAPAHLAVWRQKLQGLGDPWLQVEAAGRDASP